LKKQKKESKDTGDKKKKKKAKMNETNEGEDDDDDDEHIVLLSKEDKMKLPFTFDSSEEGQYFNINQSNVNSQSAIDECLIYYNWLADSVTTSHVTNQHDAFKTFKPLNGITVPGVGNVKAKAEGRGTVVLISYYDGHKYMLELQDVLYIPTNQNNFLSLGKWDKGGGQYVGGKGVLTLITKDGKPVVHGTKVENNLYHLNVITSQPNKLLLEQVKFVPQTLFIHEPAQSWEIWHKRYGHVSYSGLQKLLDHNLVEGFNVNSQSSKPDCIACTKSKQSIEPFGLSSDWQTVPGELTHIDLWGKYDVASINGNHYFILLVDDSEQYITTDFLKRKIEAAKKVKEYLAYLKVQDKNPKAICIDCGKEFVNKKLDSWCREHGIEIQKTVPYSPSQNGVAK
jgi:GAG-pre-integrase domain/Integrase core domain